MAKWDHKFKLLLFRFMIYYYDLDLSASDESDNESDNGSDNESDNEIVD